MKNKTFLCALFCLVFGCIVFASQTRHNYVVPTTFENGETYIKVREFLVPGNTLYVTYKSYNPGNTQQCLRKFTMDGKMKESYVSQETLFTQEVDQKSGLRFWPTTIKRVQNNLQDVARES